jgi:hypothetical protein
MPPSISLFFSNSHIDVQKMRQDEYDLSQQEVVKKRLQQKPAGKAIK